jgi:hypothetical protein
MSNHHCRFKDTASSLRDCYYNIDASLSYKEFVSRKELIELCKTIAEEWGQVDFEPEEDPSEE